MDLSSVVISVGAPLLGVLLAAGFVALLLLAPRRASGHGAAAGGGADTAQDIASFVFAEGRLIDSRGRLAQALAEPTWEAFRARYAPRFPALDMAGTDAPATFVSPDTDDPATLAIHPERRWTRVDLTSHASPALLGQMLHEAREELGNRIAALDCAPYPIWASDGQGRTTWHNSAYATLAARVRDPAENAARDGLDADDTDDSGDPATARPADPAPIFDLSHTGTRTSGRDRLAVTDRDTGATHWFEVISEKRAGQWLHFAIDINAVVHSEIAQRNFVQTLTKTFAHLSIGLAIFDRNRQLALFNPALIDLTALPADFLSLRPDLFGFFDRLRDRRMMPEPKNYAGWREQLTALVTEASHGQYCETWTLPSGLTYRVSGRPHPDGAVAFLFEDISAEISLTRRFRSELELGQGVIDTLDEAIAVFSPVGVLCLTNARYDALWPETDSTNLVELNILNCTRTWQNSCEPTPVWGDLRDFVTARRDRARWTAEVRRRDGTVLDCRFEPLPGGSTLVGFAVSGMAEDTAPRLQSVSQPA